MKGAPMHDLSSKHGTNANYKKSGAPGLLGKILDPLGLKKKIGGLFGGKGKGGACPPAGAAGAAGAAAAGATPGVQGPAAPPADEQAGPVVDPAAAAAAPMKEGLMKDSPAKDVRQSWHYGGGGIKDPGWKKHNKAHADKKANRDADQKASLSKKKKGADEKNKKK